MGLDNDKDKLTESQEKIREKINQIRKEMSEEDRGVKSKMIIDNLKKLKEYDNSKSIMSYVSMNFEVDTRELIKNELY